MTNVARVLHTATRLSDGRVLVAGGRGRSRNLSMNPVLSSTEIYNPETGLWTPANPMAQARSNHTATLLADGRVLVLGGSRFTFGEIYDPAVPTGFSSSRLPPILIRDGFGQLIGIPLQSLLNTEPGVYTVVVDAVSEEVILSTSAQFRILGNQSDPTPRVTTTRTVVIPTAVLTPTVPARALTGD